MSEGARASPYPFAAAPDIVRAHQKDAYFTGHLANTITDVYRRLLGARATHAHAPELRTLAALLYFGLTTLPGNRTLGEEYCDLVQVEGAPKPGRLPGIGKRAAYIGGTILVPYLMGRIHAPLRRLINARIARLRRHQQDHQDPLDSSLSSSSSSSLSRQARTLDFILNHLSSVTSSAQAISLALFYFNGTYYELTKRVLSLRYIFTRAMPDTPDRAGYEVLGLLLLVQLFVQAYLRLRSELRQRRALPSDPTVNVSLDHANSYAAANTDLLLPSLPATSLDPRIDLALTTHTPVSKEPRFDLASSDDLMRYIRGAQQRKCTLCLEELKDPSATQCGHVFCWECIGDWVREKPECPLCRREAMVQHILPLRVM